MLNRLCPKAACVCVCAICTHLMFMLFFRIFHILYIHFYDNDNLTYDKVKEAEEGENEMKKKNDLRNMYYNNYRDFCTSIKPHRVACAVQRSTIFGHMFIYMVWHGVWHGMVYGKHNSLYSIYGRFNFSFKDKLRVNEEKGNYF